eukprot:446928-Prymnesium_polylepis.1
MGHTSRLFALLYLVLRYAPLTKGVLAQRSNSRKLREQLHALLMARRPRHRQRSRSLRVPVGRFTGEARHDHRH